MKLDVDLGSLRAIADNMPEMPVETLRELWLADLDRPGGCRAIDARVRLPAAPQDDRPDASDEPQTESP